MFSSRRPAAILFAAIALSVVPASGCSVVLDAVGPRPDTELVQLAHQADADAASLSEPSAQALREKQARELYAEISRVCGVDSDGRPPASCEVKQANEATGAANLADAGEAMARFTADEAQQLPDGSIDLVVAQVVDTLAASDFTLPGAPEVLTDEQDARAALEMAQREYAFRYGLGLASAYADDALQERIDALQDASQERLGLLATVVPEQLHDPAVAAGYEFQGIEPPTTTEAASALVDSLVHSVVGQWRVTAADANTGTWLYTSAHLAAHAQRGQ
ncbi:hypothetical protein [Corynebacterium cystitidis]|uniref:hypothetical protein n=1 Tax=Corynebacterium cystitidis TaxID=35757 RepID=UPI00115F86E0|nr:hypothetical protein [Corynebacterium cystitidis]